MPATLVGGILNAWTSIGRLPPRIGDTPVVLDAGITLDSAGLNAAPPIGT
jgi:hypothetical protein